MTHTRLSLAATFALLGAALPAYAQAPVPAPVAAPAMAPAAQAPAPAPIMPARTGDDLTGTVGFGVGIVAGDELIKPDTGSVITKYWLNDAIALVPQLNFNITKNTGSDTAWKLEPQLRVDFTLLKGASTRLEGGAGLGLAFGKNVTAPAALTGATTSSNLVGIFVPVALQVEHFFTRWFAMSVGAQFNLLEYEKQGPSTFMLDIDNITYMANLFFYTD